MLNILNHPKIATSFLRGIICYYIDVHNDRNDEKRIKIINSEQVFIYSILHSICQSIVFIFWSVIFILLCSHNICLKNRFEKKNTKQFSQYSLFYSMNSEFCTLYCCLPRTRFLDTLQTHGTRKTIKRITEKRITLYFAK